MIRLFKKKENYGGLFLFLLLLFLQLSGFLKAYTIGEEIKLFTLHFSLLSFILNTAFLFIYGLLINNIVNRYQFFDSASNLPAAIFFCLTPFIPNSQSVDIWLIVLFFLLLILNKLIKAFQKERPGRNYFDSAFLVGLLVLFQGQYLILLFILFIALFILNVPKLSLLKLILIGFLFPLIIVFLIVSVTTNYLTVDGFLINKQALSLLNPLPFKPSLFSVVLIMISVLFALSYFFWQTKKPYLSYYQKTILQVCSLQTFLFIVICFLYPNLQFHTLIGCFFTLSILVSFMLIKLNENLAKLLFIIICGFAFVYPWIKDLNLNL